MEDETDPNVKKVWESFFQMELNHLHKAADMLGLTRQTAVLAFQLGDAFTNVMAPTGGEILAALAICKVPFKKWAKFLLPLFIIWWIVAFIFLIYAAQVGYGPF